LGEVKIFGIGLSKTGTSSLSRALEVLGYSCVHFPRNDRAIAAHDASTDAPVAEIFEELDRRFPGSKFIYTVRDRERWLRSCERYYAVRQRRPDELAVRLRRAFYGTVEFDAELFAAGYERHEQRVLDYFAGRPDDLLVLDLTGADAGWEKLCGFLGREVPSVDFPLANKTVPIDELLIRALRAIPDLEEVSRLSGVPVAYLEELREGEAFELHDSARRLSLTGDAKSDKIATRLARHFGSASAAEEALGASEPDLRAARARHRRRKLDKLLKRNLPPSVYRFVTRSG